GRRRGAAGLAAGFERREPASPRQCVAQVLDTHPPCTYERSLMASQDWLEKDFYKVLGVSTDVSDAELKKTYRKLARQYHPDSNPGDASAEARFKEISEANSVLSDPEQRREYDQVRAMGLGQPDLTSCGRGQAGCIDDALGRTLA